ncbi:MaoC/PaaZ C-terminal domain-containing protein [Arthrobacter yangruifuii]|uniref:MaoC/PaaZ C-terminal domain-containing protein n=1 Tax=Arthrobacter yangruifuii TaxID=2606616 RepID=UPI0011B77334|nr:MaoC/PaaZ C-terminal domain-containing protein [Arthrobacter yangruifuii]
MTDTQLSEIPALGRLYAGALGSAAKSRLSPSKSTGALPADRHVVRGASVNLARLTEFQHLVLHSATDYLPTGYVHTFAFPVAMSLMAREDFPLPLLGMVHLRNEVQHLRPIHYGEPLTVTAWAENLGGHRAGTQVELVAEVTVEADGGPETVWRGRSTYLAKGVFLPKIDRPEKSAVRAEFVPPLPTALWRLGSDAGRSYARVSGDFNPIHLSRLSAKALGMKQSLAHGMYLASRVVADAVQSHEGPFQWSIDFESPVFLPATVAVAITDDNEASGSWAGATFTGWNPRSHRRHFTGSVTPLDSAAGSSGFSAAAQA